MYMIREEAFSFPQMANNLSATSVEFLHSLKNVSFSYMTYVTLMPSSVW